MQVSEEVFRADYAPTGTTGRILLRGDVTLDTLREAYPDADFRTAGQAAEEDSEEIRQMLSFFTYILLAFGLIALLRALGMSRPQLTGSVLVEAALIGVVGSALGILAGMGLVSLIVAVMEAFGLGFPNAGLGLNTQSVVVPLLVGIVVTVISAWVPARRAGRVHPVASTRSRRCAPVTSPPRSRSGSAASSAACFSSRA